MIFRKSFCYYLFSFVSRSQVKTLVLNWNQEMIKCGCVKILTSWEPLLSVECRAAWSLRASKIAALDVVPTIPLRRPLAARRDLMKSSACTAPSRLARVASPLKVGAGLSSPSSSSSIGDGVGLGWEKPSAWAISAAWLDEGPRSSRCRLVAIRRYRRALWAEKSPLSSPARCAGCLPTSGLSWMVGTCVGILVPQNVGTTQFISGMFEKTKNKNNENKHTNKHLYTGIKC